MEELGLLPRAEKDQEYLTTHGIQKIPKTGISTVTLSGYLTSPRCWAKEIGEEQHIFHIQNDEKEIIIYDAHPGSEIEWECHGFARKTGDAIRTVKIEIGSDINGDGKVEKFRMYVAKGCPHCEAALTFLKNKNLSVEVIEVGFDPILQAGMRAMSNNQGLPLPVTVSFATQEVIIGNDSAQLERIASAALSNGASASNPAVQ